MVSDYAIINMVNAGVGVEILIERRLDALDAREIRELYELDADLGNDSPDEMRIPNEGSDSGRSLSDEPG